MAVVDHFPAPQDLFGEERAVLGQRPLILLRRQDEESDGTLSIEGKSYLTQPLEVRLAGALDDKEVEVAVLTGRAGGRRVEEDDLLRPALLDNPVLPVSDVLYD